MTDSFFYVPVEPGCSPFEGRRGRHPSVCNCSKHGKGTLTMEIWHKSPSKSKYHPESNKPLPKRCSVCAVCGLPTVNGRKTCSRKCWNQVHYVPHGGRYYGRLAWIVAPRLLPPDDGAEWKIIPGMGNIYEASSSGAIRNNRTGRVMKTHLRRGGYEYLRLRIEGNRNKGYAVHRLVAAAFLGPSILSVNHKDHDRRNNAVENLEYLPSSENARDAVAWKAFRTKISLVESENKRLRNLVIRLGGNFDGKA